MLHAQLRVNIMAYVGTPAGRLPFQIQQSIHL